MGTRGNENETAYCERFAYVGTPVLPDASPRADRDTLERAIGALLQLGRWGEALSLVDDRPDVACDRADVVAAQVAYHLAEGQAKRARYVLERARVAAVESRKRLSDREALRKATGSCPPDLVDLSEVVSVCVQNKLEAFGVLTVSRLVSMSADDLLSIPQFGSGNLRQVVEGLDRCGVRHNFGPSFHK